MADDLKHSLRGTSEKGEVGVVSCRGRDRILVARWSTGWKAPAGDRERRCPLDIAPDGQRLGTKALQTSSKKMALRSAFMACQENKVRTTLSLTSQETHEHTHIRAEILEKGAPRKRLLISAHCPRPFCIFRYPEKLHTAIMSTWLRGVLFALLVFARVTFADPVRRPFRLPEKASKKQVSGYPVVLFFQHFSFFGFKLQLAAFGVS